MAGPSSYYNDDLASEFDTDSDYERTRKKRLDLAVKTRAPPKRKADKDFFDQERSKEDRKRSFLAVDAYTRHKMLVNEYLLCYPGTASKILKRDTSRDKTDLDIIRENSKFLWDESQQPVSWGQKLAKRYYEKLFKEYCVADLSRYKENKIALRWRVEKEVVDGKGQFICGDKRCDESQDLCSWEVNFAYLEEGEKKNALVKLRLCPECSYKLNYHHRRQEAKKARRRDESLEEVTHADLGDIHVSGTQASATSSTADEPLKNEKSIEEQKFEEKEHWSKPIQVEEDKSKEDEFAEFLEEMFV